MTRDQLIDRVRRLWEYDDASAILKRIEELDWPREHAEVLAEAVGELATGGDSLKSKDKPRVDRALLRLVRVLPEEVTSGMLFEFVQHPRQPRRKIAWRALKDGPLSKSDAEKLLARAEEIGDSSLAVIVARREDLAAQFDPDRLLALMPDDYWRMRVLEVAVPSHPDCAPAWRDSHPREFLHAVGRIGNPEYLSLIRPLLQTHMEDLDFVSFYIWALGKLGAETDIDELERELFA